MDQGPDTRHHVMSVLYELAFLEAQKRAGMRLGTQAAARCDKLQAALTGDPGWSRRQHRRLSLMLPAVLKRGMRSGRATIGDMSASGAYLATTIHAEVGDQLLLQVDDNNEVRYSFSCRVVRVSRESVSWLIGVVFEGIPLEVRFGRRPVSNKLSFPIPLGVMARALP